MICVVKAASAVGSSNLLKTLGGVLLLTISSYVKIPFYPVSITLQTLAIGVNMIIFGKTLSAVVGWIMLGLAANYMGCSNAIFSASLMHSLGYIIGFLFLGLLLEVRNINILLRYVVGVVVVLFLGGLWLNVMHGISFWLGVLPYVIGECVKMLIFYMISRQYGDSV